MHAAYSTRDAAWFWAASYRPLRVTLDTPKGSGMILVDDLICASHASHNRPKAFTFNWGAVGQFGHAQGPRHRGSARLLAGVPERPTRDRYQSVGTLAA